MGGEGGGSHGAAVGVGGDGGGSGGSGASGHALEPLKLRLGPMVEGWVGGWGAGAMKP